MPETEVVQRVGPSHPGGHPAGVDGMDEELWPPPCHRRHVECWAWAGALSRTFLPSAVMAVAQCSVLAHAP